MKFLDQLERRRGWSSDERMVLDQVRRLCQELIGPSAEHHDRTGEFPAENLAALNALGLNAIFVPEAYGGSPMSYRLYLEVVKTIAEACASTGIIYATNFHGMKPLVDFGSEEQKARLLPRIAEGGIGALAITENSAGSDATGMKTRFRPDGDEIVVDGNKLFITNGDVADLILLFGKWSEIDDARAAISVLVFEKGTPGFEVVRLEDKMGHRGSSTAAIAFHECRVPHANLIGNPGDGLRILLASLNKSRPSIAAHALGIARAAFSDAVAYSNQRRQFGHALLEFQGNQFTFADLSTELAMTELWLDYVGRLIDDGEVDFGLEASMAKMRASDLAMRLSTEAVQMHGGYGYCKDYRVERLMRDAKITQIWEGTNQLHRQLIGRSLIAK
ncbi:MULTISPECIES: acyl-CoA dehydrogenase family protein [unclassified Mesorhizobium]|uniref:acyl-CoA dehydrogenase family protein n=1 Tax=unclassified Mesorhizobium TaxID=325217 RepID=UPI002416D6FD|nr:MULTISPECIES: acyl-CoA dehydrogenase family protein [unclassified Mesorhizobium]WFP65564.1 acyl-CoA dehydrogenase family protein [Mesorhizobium sp. WSM4904]WFP78829.1 acyl-CoA dehydrogenase family protein [Mesorhizobium sp. WSM4906]